MPHKILCDGVKAWFSRQQMDFLGKFSFQLFLLGYIHICIFDGIQNTAVDFRIFDIQNLFTTVFVVQGNRCAVIYGSLEVVDRDIAAEGAFRDVVAGQQRRTGKAQSGSCGQQSAHVIGEGAVLATVSLIRHDDNVVVGINGWLVRLVELLDQGENEAGIPPELCHQIGAAGGDELGCLGGTQQAAILKGIADLLVQLVPVGQDHDGWRTGKFAADLLGQEHHRIAFSAALRVPEHTQLAISQFSGFIGLHRLVDAQVLVVAGQDFYGVHLSGQTG